jgi:hypothetical protein
MQEEIILEPRVVTCYVLVLVPKILTLITVAARYKAWTVFAPSNAGIVGSKPTQGIDICVSVNSVFMLSYV